MVLHHPHTRRRRLLGKHLQLRLVRRWFHHQCKTFWALHKRRHPPYCRLSLQPQPNRHWCPRKHPLMCCSHRRHHLVILYLVRAPRGRKANSTTRKRVKFVTRKGYTLASSRYRLLCLLLRRHHQRQVKWINWSSVFSRRNVQFLDLASKPCLLMLLLLLRTTRMHRCAWKSKV